MDKWKIQFIVVTFVAILQTFEAVSSTVEEERWLPEHWQVKKNMFGFLFLTLLKGTYLGFFFTLSGWFSEGGSKLPNGQSDEKS